MYRGLHNLLIVNGGPFLFFWVEKKKTLYANNLSFLNMGPVLFVTLKIYWNAT